jgi:hypothetical protein
MINFKLRRISDLAICTFEFDHTSIDMGCLDNKEAKDLLEGFKQAVDELEWFINATEKEEV